MTSGDPLPANPDGGRILGSSEGPVPIVRLYGITNNGMSITSFIHGFTPYFYASLSNQISLDENNLGQIRTHLDQKVYTQFTILFLLISIINIHNY